MAHEKKCSEQFDHRQFHTLAKKYYIQKISVSWVLTVSPLPFSTALVMYKL